MYIQSYCFLVDILFAWYIYNVSELLKSPTIIVFLLITSFMFVISYFIYLGAPFLGA